MHSNEPKSQPGPLDVTTVLRYWLAMIRHEEALGQKLRAVTRPRPQQQANVVSPVAGQIYFKLLADGIDTAASELADDEVKAAIASFLVLERDELHFHVSGERAAFCEHVLDGAYRRERNKRFGGGDEGSGEHVAGFPAFYDARRGELACLLRFPVAPPDWLDAEGEPWKEPAYKTRKQGNAIDGPATMKLAEIGGDADPEDVAPLPYALDVQQASQTLGIIDEHVGRLLRELGERELVSPGDMIGAVAALVGHDGVDYPEAAIAEALASDEPAPARLKTLFAAIAQRPLPHRVRMFPIGLVWDASQQITTHGLQRDLRQLIAEGAPRRPTTALGSYLLGEPTEQRVSPHVGLRGPHELTDDQRAVAERSLGQRLVCAQGPPGTGKTELIGNLAAQRLLAQMAGASAGSPPVLPQCAPLVVTSTNNRAVDNVIDPLSHDLPINRLPLALRVGSQLVMREVTVPLLARSLAWLEAGDVERAERRWPSLQAELTAAYSGRLAEVQAGVMSRRAEVELPGLRERLSTLEQQLGTRQDALDALGEARGAALVEVARIASAWRDDVLKATAKLERMARVSETKAKRLWTRAEEAHGDALRESAELGELTCKLASAPKDGASGDAWLDAYDRLEDQLDQLAESAWELTASDGLTREQSVLLDTQVRAVREQIAALEAAPALDPSATVATAEDIGLFELACEAREVWALLNRERLVVLLRKLAGPKRRQARGGLRVQLNNEAMRRELFELFPVVGCTLLSLGNAFPWAEDVIDHAIIDEAGQCHPAYVVSALGRARRVLVIGDPHQLEPVIGLDEREEDRVLRRGGWGIDKAELEPFRCTSSTGNSAQTLAARATDDVLVLRDHFRCQPEIIRVSDALCGYGLRVLTPPASLSAVTGELPAPVVLHDVRGAQLAQAGSWANLEEVDRVVEVIGRLMRHGIRPRQIGVLTPYRGQLMALRSAFRTAGLPVEERMEPDAQADLFGDPGPGALALGTVHRFQGGERDVVIFSTVITRERSLAFTNAKVNLVNVAVSRARQHLVVVGDRELLEKGAVTSTLVRAATPALR